MKLFELALAAHERLPSLNRFEEEQYVRAQVKDLERWIETMFGVPFDEAFDRSKIEVLTEGDDGVSLRIDGHVVIGMTEEAMRVVVFEPGFAAHRVDEMHFTRGGDNFREHNLEILGHMLAKARLTAENRKARAA